MTVPGPQVSQNTAPPAIAPRDAWLQTWFEAFAKKLDQQNHQLEKINNSVTLTFWLLLLVLLAGGCSVLLSLGG